jgi:hypothetical protein
VPPEIVALLLESENTRNYSVMNDADPAAPIRHERQDVDMTFRVPDDPAGLALIRRYVVWAADSTSVRSRIRRSVRVADPATDGARYLRLLHANFLQEHDPSRDTFASALAEDARQISDADLGTLLEFEWRARLTAAWLIGLDQRTQFRQTLGDLLLESELVYAGQGYCFAFSRFAQPEDADLLTAYLDRYLPGRTATTTRTTPSGHSFTSIRSSEPATPNAFCFLTGSGTDPPSPIETHSTANAQPSNSARSPII